ncbi:MAG: protein kinase domain-containing protein [Burkholderiales bacterium]
MTSWHPGSEIDGFCLGELISAGSMAFIYRLTGPKGPLPLVIKIPRLGPGERAANVISFEVERMVLGALAQSPHRPTLVAFGDVESTPYLVMEYVEGARLSAWVERAPVPPQELARLCSALALALHELHRQDVVHLDVKPTNVLYRSSGEAVLVDFGLAHHSHYPDLLAEEIRVPVGNWPYMSPEQVLGVRCDPRSDIFALGAILYRLATTRLPFGLPSTSAQLRQRLFREPLPPRALVHSTPEWLQEIIFHCLEVDARDRYASAAELAFDLANPAQVALTERGSRRRRAGLGKRLRRWARARHFEPAPCPPPSMPSTPVPVVVVALAMWKTSEPLLQALRHAAHRAMVADPDCRIACVTVVPHSAGLSDIRDEDPPTDRHIKRLVELRRWARPLEAREECLTYHVLESDKPARALIDFASMNDVDQVLIGSPRSGAPSHSFAGVCAQVVADVPCSVTVVRPRPES